MPKGEYFIQSLLHQELNIAVGKYKSDRLSLELKKMREVLELDNGRRIAKLLKDCGEHCFRKCSNSQMIRWNYPYQIFRQRKCPDVFADTTGQRNVVNTLPHTDIFYHIPPNISIGGDEKS